MKELPNKKLILTVLPREKDPNTLLVHIDANCIISIVEQLAINRVVNYIDIVNSSDGIQKGLSNKLGISIDDYNRKINDGEKLLYPIGDNDMLNCVFPGRNHYDNLLGIERIPSFYVGPKSGIFDKTLEQIANPISRPGPKINIANMVRARAIDYFLYDELVKQRKNLAQISLRRGIDELLKKYPHEWIYSGELGETEK